MIKQSKTKNDKTSTSTNYYELVHTEAFNNNDE